MQFTLPGQGACFVKKMNSYLHPLGGGCGQFRIAVYYGAADSYVGLAFTTADELVDYILAHDETSAADRELGRR